MTKLLSLEEKINKILEYCEYTKQLATDAGHKVRYLVEFENTGEEIETEQQCVESKQIDYTGDNRMFLHCVICQAVLDAQQYSEIHNCLSSVKVCIVTHGKDGVIFDREPIDDYEINFERGIAI